MLYMGWTRPTHTPNCPWIQAAPPFLTWRVHLLLRLAQLWMVKKEED